MGENKEPIKIRLSTAILIIIIIILLAIMAIGYIIYGKKDKTSKENQLVNTKIESTNSATVENETTMAEDKTTELSINNNLVKELYSDIPAIGAIQFDGKDKTSYSVYQNKNVTMKDMDDSYILYFVAKNKLEIKYDDKQNFSAEETLEKTDGSWYSFDANILQNKIKELYGNNSNIKNQSFGYYGEGWEYKENENKYYYSIGGGGSGSGTFDIAKLVKAEQKDGEIDLYSKYIAYDVDYENEICALYSDETKTDKIKDCNFKEYEKQFADSKSTTQPSKAETAEEHILSNDENLMKTYKHVFKSDENGNYHWYSTEPVEK